MPSSINLPKRVQKFAKYQTKISQRLLKFGHTANGKPILQFFFLSEANGFEATTAKTDKK